MNDTHDAELVARVAGAIQQERTRIHRRDMVHGFDRSVWEQARAAVAAVWAHDGAPTGGTLEDALKETGWPNVYVEYARGEFFAIHGVPARSVVDEMRKKRPRTFGRGDTISEAIHNAIRAALAAGESTP